MVYLYSTYKTRLSYPFALGEETSNLRSIEISPFSRNDIKSNDELRINNQSPVTNH